VDSCSAFVTAARWTTASARQRYKRTPHLPKPAATRDLAITNRNCCGGPASPLLIKGAGRRPQRPGNQSRIRVSGVPAGSAAIIRHSGLSRFRFTHSQPERCAPQYKSNPRLCRTCGRSAFPVEERGKLRKIRGPRRRCSASAAGRCAFQVTLEVVFCEKWGLYFPNRVWRPSPWAREGHDFESCR
jgi:hypothetical protein